MPLNLATKKLLVTSARIWFFRGWGMRLKSDRQVRKWRLQSLDVKQNREVEGNGSFALFVFKKNESIFD